MKYSAVETQFIKWLLNKHPSLVESKIKRKGPGENRPHVRFSSGCGVNNKEDFLKLFEGMNYTPMPANEFSKSYTVGGYIQWNNKSVGVLYGIAKDGHSERKRWSPESLGLAQFETNNVKNFKKKIIDGLTAINEPEVELFIQLLDNVEHKTTFNHSEFLEINKSKITSDFGEILAAYDDVVKGRKIKFSNKSNQKVNDYFVFTQSDWQGISVKNPKGGGKVNLSDYVDLIDISNDSNIHAKILHSIGSYNRDKLFEFSAKVCPQVKKIASIIGGTDKKSKIKYVETHSYDEFYKQIQTDPLFVLKKETLGVPSEQDWKPNELTPRHLWNNGSLDPLDFTLNTLISRFWGANHVEEISDVVTKFLNKSKFKIVDIVDGNVTIQELEFKDVNKWKTVYWSRATKAWHNWISVEPVKETK